MRYIRKNLDAGFALDRANGTPPITNKQAGKKWGRFKAKKHVKERLCKEQFWLCAYTEIRPDEEELGSHIEHVKPKSQFPSSTFDYENLVYSALSVEDFHDSEGAEPFGGHAKKDIYTEELFVSCLQEGCENYFSYISTGEVVPFDSLSEVDIERAEYTISLLNLNASYLVNRRKNWLDEVEEYIDDHLSDVDSLQHLAGVYLLPWNDKLDPFFTASRQRFQGVGDKVLEEEAPFLL